VDDKCLENFVRMMWCCCSTWQGLGGGGAAGRRGGRAAAAEGRRRVRGQGVPVGESAIGRHGELQEDDVVLVAQEIGKGELGFELPTARPNGGGAGSSAARGKRGPGA
jgi:hypothetical protein